MYVRLAIRIVRGLTDYVSYLTAGTFRQHINKTNPLGTGGVLVDKFAELLRVMWYGKYNFISPVSFRVSGCDITEEYQVYEQCCL